MKKDSQFFETINYYLFVGLCGKTNNLMFCDLSEMKIISTITIPNCEYVRDISIWNNNNNNTELSLIACQKVNFHSIRLVTNFENLQILDFSKETGGFRPVNIRKVLVRDKKDGILKEHLVILQWESGEKNQVLFY